MRPESLEETRDAWRRYTSIGAISEKQLRGPTYRAWVRSHEQGANPQLLRAAQLTELETERLLDRERHLVQAARPYLELLSQAAGRERHAAMLADRNTVVLDVVGDQASVRGPERVPGPGSLLSEGVAGANGLGTPLVENAYVELVGAEHFIAGFHAFTCQGIPLRGPEGRIVGALSTSVRRQAVSRRLREILVCAAHAIEAELLRLQLEENVSRVLHADMRDQAPVEKLRHAVLLAQQGLKLRLKAAAVLVAENRFEQTLQLLALAHEIIQQFERRARLWHDLVSGEAGSLQPIELVEVLSLLVELLTPEATERGITLIVGRTEYVVVQSDRKSLCRQLFHGLMEAMDAAGRGGLVRVEILHRLASRSGEALLLALPGPGGLLPAPLLRTFPFPIAISS